MIGRRGCRSRRIMAKPGADRRSLVPGDVSGGRGPVRNKPLRLAADVFLPVLLPNMVSGRRLADISDDDGASGVKSSAVQIEGLRYQAGEKSTVILL